MRVTRQQGYLVFTERSSHIIKLRLLTVCRSFSPWQYLSVSRLLAAREGKEDGTGGVIGEVSLVLGEALIRSDGGGRDNVDRGMVIPVGDEIETRANGYVHIRFIDDALVSVRPNSRLSIERYDFDASRPERSAVKFSLTEGCPRHIGQAAKAAVTVSG